VRPKGNKLVTILLASVPLAAIGVAAALAGPDPISQPVQDGCARDRGAIFTHDVPNWAYVNDRDYPANGPLPPLQWAHGVAQSAYDPERAAHPAGVDDPFTHTSYDFVFNPKVDPQDEGLLGGSRSAGTGNYAGKDEETGRLHTERESGTFPSFAWPDRGDRVAMRGAWVWDCDHAGLTGERTEIHPLNAIFVQRSPSPNSPYGDTEGDVFVTSASTPADRQAECAHKTKGDRTAFKSCVATSGGSIDVGGSYEFSLKAPPRPSKTAKLAYRIVDRGSANAPELRVAPKAAGVSIAFDLASGTDVKVAKQVFVGWRPMPASKLPVHLRADFRELLVRRAMDPGCPLDNPKCKYRNETTRVGQYSASPGEWSVYTDAGGVWSQWGLLRPHDGQRIKTRRKVDFYVARGAPWRLFVQTRECDFGSVGNAYSPNQTVWPCPHANELGNPIGDDEPGILVDHFRSPATGLGTHHSDSRLDGSTCPPSNKHGCYALTYSVRRVSSAHR
jgi:hypothetical protein